MQRFNPNLPGRNGSILTVTRQETHKELNDPNDQKCFTENILKRPENKLNQSFEIGIN